MRIDWLPEALRDLEGQLNYIAERNPVIAVEIDRRIEVAVSRLVEFPESAPRGRAPATRELVIGGTPFVVIYRVKKDLVEILRLIHGAQSWPPDVP